MFDLPVHPKFVHVPLGLVVIVPLFLLVLLVAIRKGWLPPHSWWLGVAAAVVVAGGCWVAVLTGESEQERIEKVVAETFIERHEDAGKELLVGAVFTAVLALAAAFVRETSVRLGVQAAATLAAGITLLLGVRAGLLGGELVYRHGAASYYATGAGGQAAKATPKAADEAEDED